MQFYADIYEHISEFIPWSSMLPFKMINRTTAQVVDLRIAEIVDTFVDIDLKKYVITDAIMILQALPKDRLTYLYNIVTDQDTMPALRWYHSKYPINLNWYYSSCYVHSFDVAKYVLENESLSKKSHQDLINILTASVINLEFFKWVYYHIKCELTFYEYCDLTSEDDAIEDWLASLPENKENVQRKYIYDHLMQ